MSNDPFSVPTSDFVKLTDPALLGHLLLISPTEFVSQMPTMHGASDAIRVDFVDLTDEDATEYEDSLVFSRVIVPALKKKINGMVLGVLAQGEKKKGHDAPWILREPSEEQKQVARDYLTAKAAATPDPFATA